MNCMSHGFTEPKISTTRVVRTYRVFGLSSYSSKHSEQIGMEKCFSKKKLKKISSYRDYFANLILTFETNSEICGRKCRFPKIALFLKFYTVILFNVCLVFLYRAGEFGHSLMVLMKNFIQDGKTTPRSLRK